MKPVIGIVSHVEVTKSPLQATTLGNPYVVSVEKTGGTPIILPCYIHESDIDTYLNLCDGFIFSGGIDISPSFYNEEPHAKLGTTDYALDESQFTFMKKVLEHNKPVLGICRGHQVLTVASGGTLYQDLSEQEGVYLKHFQDTSIGNFSHKIFFEPDSILHDIFGDWVYGNSYHHQATKEAGPDTRIIAYSEDKVVEAIQVQSQKFALGIQWHPEAMFAHGSETMRPLFEAFIHACKTDENTK